MKILAGQAVLTADDVIQDPQIKLRSEDETILKIPDSIAYLPLINSHDHLVGNWTPQAGDKRPYPNSHIWVEDMKESQSFLERNKFWLNDGSFVLSAPPALTVARLGAYKNLFSGCGIVQDHGPLQQDSYYEAMPIKVIKRYRQCHSLTLGNWWGGESPQKEMELSGGEMPFIVHLGEGTDEITHQEFAQLKSNGLLKENTLMIHGIAFSEDDIIDIARAGASVCWCPSSNFYLIGKTFDITSAIKHNANVVIGTDSTMSGAINLIGEFDLIRQKFPQISPRELYRMVTENAVKALYLPPRYAKLDPENAENLLLVDQNNSDPFENLMNLKMSEIKLLVVDSIPLYGDGIYLKSFGKQIRDYSFFDIDGREKFVVGDPQMISQEIDLALGYHKDFPFLPF